ncbi:MAG: hypothetical protein AB7G93_08370, partial [Bdellovibrionales bacterium]
VSKAEFWAHLGPIRISTGNSAQKIMKNMNLVNNANLNFGFGFLSPHVPSGAPAVHGYVRLRG